VFGAGTFDVVPLVLARFDAQYPRVNVVLNHGQTPVQIRALRPGRVLIRLARPRPNQVANVEN
jgi:LysR family transcriptional regulator, benzoate and cis,cis-muconate-responsive activator of ben and cat genes